ncbi:bacillithiol system redox-active protein YtxJ [Alkalicoccus urumqiensis]|uniref:Bacillithiol system redox-active protein YtxJ n=1 Tax=Alkalicoccus urumqiensis TaxID=1548213 RepID=A0A2P6MGK8_ALKUR|nr:bacillithiol system redox-active protein YtxJ [Alkalicoccus urumqiensis]PRO65407.1 bacillithiol system redox-active protein YtxJ [Alkalicoccus urumqiensis]
MMTIIDASSELDELLETSNRFFLMKHSLTCPVSADAMKEMEQAEPELRTPVYVIHVQEFRGGCTKTADHYGVKHESPQVLLIDGGKVQNHTSHWHVTADWIKAGDEAAGN